MNYQQMSLFGEQESMNLRLYQGGLPCQPHSVAGKRKASSDERDLWPEMRRVIGDLRPKWVVAENVPGLLTSEDGRFFRGILRDFAEMWYCVGWGITSAAGVGALHKRERVAIVAHTDSKRSQRWLLEKEQQKANEQFEGTYLHLLRSADEKYLSQSAILRRSNGVPSRVDRTKCLGNAVVPQQFYPIFKAIAETERMTI